MQNAKCKILESSNFAGWQNFNTLILIFDFDFLNFGCCEALAKQQPPLTFSHWSGVSPYTSSYELAGTCVFGKQSPGVLSLRPSPVLVSSKLFLSRLNNSILPLA